MGCHAELGQNRGDADGTEEVHLDRLVERRVEAHDCRRVDEDVASGDCGTTGVVQPEAVDCHVSRHGGDALGGHLGEPVSAELVPETVKGVVAQDVPIDPASRSAAARSYHEDQFAVGDRSQQSLHQGGAEESGAPCDCDAASGQ